MDTLMISYVFFKLLQWRHNGRDGVSNHQPHQCLLNRLFGRRSQKASELRVTGLCAENSPETGELPAQMVSSAENVSIWWRHREILSSSKDPDVVPERQHFCSKYEYEEGMPSRAVTVIYFSSDMKSTGLSLCYSLAGGKRWLYFQYTFDWNKKTARLPFSWPRLISCVCLF